LCSVSNHPGQCTIIGSITRGEDEEDSSGIGALQDPNKGYGGVCSTHYSSKSKSAMRERRNKICREYSAGYTKDDRVVGEKWPTVDTSKRI
jgi:hypothetical protein